MIEKNKQGVSTDEIQSQLTNVTDTLVKDAINKLLVSKITVFKKGETLLFRLKPQLNISGKSSIERNELETVLGIIAEAENKGIWINHITKKTGLPTVRLDKILKALVQNKSIKLIKSVVESKKKIYMLYELVPDVSVTGGAFYSDQEFDTELANILHDYCYRFLEDRKKSQSHLADPIIAREASFASSEDILEFIKNLGIVKIELTLDDIEKVLYTLVLDKKAKKKTRHGMNCYVCRSDYKPTGVVLTPCGLCPVSFLFFFYLFISIPTN